MSRSVEFHWHGKSDQCPLPIYISQLWAPAVCFARMNRTFVICFQSTDQKGKLLWFRYASSFFASGKDSKRCYLAAGAKWCVVCSVRSQPTNSTAANATACACIQMQHAKLVAFGGWNEFQKVALSFVETISWNGMKFMRYWAAQGAQPDPTPEMHWMHLQSNPQRSLTRIRMPPGSTASHGRHVTVARTTINLKILALNFC